MTQKAIVTHALNATTLMGNIHSKLNNKRKELIGKTLPADVKEVCSAQREVTTQLFGDDLGKAVREAKELNKLSNDLSPGYRPPRKPAFSKTPAPKPHKWVPDGNTRVAMAQVANILLGITPIRPQIGSRVFISDDAPTGGGEKQITRVSNNHNAFVASVEKLKSHLTNKVKTFQAGCLKQHKASWEALTSDSEVLSTASGLPVEFETTPHLPQRPNRFAKAEQQIIIHQEIEKLLKKGVIKKSILEEGEIISPIFLRNKPDGTFRLILNLKEANKHIDSIHFKMETINSILKLVRPNCYMANVDIKDAYQSLSVKMIRNTSNLCLMGNYMPSPACLMDCAQDRVSLRNS